MPIQFFGIPCDHTVDCTCDLLNKNLSNRQYVAYMLNRTSMMFEYDGLPDTIPAYMVELYLQIFGSFAFAKVDGKYYILYGNAGGPPDPYNRPTQFIVANPALTLSKTYKIDNHLPPAKSQQEAWNSYESCIYVRNDTNAIGLIPLYSRYATQLTENDISIRSAQINSRQQSLISASTAAEVESAEKYINNLENGKISAVCENAFFNGIKAQNVSTMSSNSIIQLIELQQYLKASWFNDIGLNANFNMKREYLSTEEIQASTDVLLPLADDMLQCRKDAVDAINKLFSLNISVKKNSAWENKEEEIAAAQQEMTDGDPVEEPKEVTGDE